MRKLILFLSVISMSLFLTSCLEAGETNYQGKEEFFYITQSEGLQVAYNWNFTMTSPEIKAKETNRWYRITWSWTTENGMVATNIHNAITSQIEQVPQGSFIQEEAPENVTPILNFDIISGLPIIGVYGDFLIFQYVWNKKEGETVQARLYNNETEISNNGVITLDLRLDKTGTSTETTGENTDELASVKVSTLRNLINFDGQDYKDIQLKFNYYKTSEGQPTSVTYPIRIYKS